MPETPEYAAWKAAYAAEFTRHAEAYGPHREAYNPGFGGYTLTADFLRVNIPHMKQWVADHPAPESAYMTSANERTFTLPLPC